MAEPLRDAAKAVVLLSGGIDSAITAAIAREQGFSLYALSVDYGQRHAVELRAAARVAELLGVAAHLIERIDLRLFGGSALTDGIEVPKSRDVASLPAGIPVTYVPARNTIFLSLALAYAEVLDARDIFVGANAVDYSGYPDCRPAFIEAFQRLANVATRSGVEGTAIRIHAPLIEMTKGEIIREALHLGVDLSLTHSCYDPSASGAACGACDSCLLRLKGFADAGWADVIPYVDRTTPSA
jgi:7-cyano-7-deazaguanine synthase